jgi:hypothetical protein
MIVNSHHLVLLLDTEVEVQACDSVQCRARARVQTQVQAQAIVDPNHANTDTRTTATNAVSLLNLIALQFVLSSHFDWFVTVLCFCSFIQYDDLFNTSYFQFRSV